MATKTPSQGGTTCPLCDDYSGQPSSVEAHISRMTDPLHQGEVGRGHRDDLERQVAETGEVESSDDQAVETSVEEASGPDFPEGGGRPLADTDTADLEDREDGESDDRADDLEDQDDSADELEESAGIPIPVSSTTLLAGSVTFLVLVYLYRRSQRQERQQSRQDEQNQEEPVETGSGLIGT